MKCTSPFLSNMSGKLGGAVFGKARGGIQWVRELVVPTNPSTFLQTAMRNAVSSASAAWRSVLTELQQQLWWDLAASVEGGATGKTLFARINQARIYATNTGRLIHGESEGDEITAIPVVADPPESMSLAITGLPAVTIDDSANTLTIAAVPEGETWYTGAAGAQPAVMYVYVSAGQSPSRFSREHPYQLVAAVYFTSGTDFIPAVINLAALGLPTIAGYAMYVKRYVQSPDGSISLPVEERVTIVA